MIGHSSFSGCRNLQRITNGFPETLLIIDDFAFYICTALHGQLVIPPNVTRLGRDSFALCSSLTSVVFEPSTTATTLAIGGRCFLYCTELLSVDFSERIDEFSDFLFGSGCTSLNRIIIRSSNMRFGTQKFGGCPSSLTIEAYPWLYPTIFASINNPSLIYQTFHEYHHRILGEATIADDGVVTRQHPNGRRRRRELHKRQRLRR